MTPRQFGRMVAVAVLITMLTLTPPQAALALSCIQMSPAEHVSRAQVIFTGTVGQSSGEWTTVDVDRYYKSTGPAAVTVKTDKTWGRSIPRTISGISVCAAPRGR